MRTIILIISLMLVTNLNAVVKNPYENISDSDKILALTDKFISEAIYIDNPAYPDKPIKPTIKKEQVIVKGKFEKTSDFKIRVDKLRVERNLYLAQVEKDYKNRILAYNQKVKKITDDYNVKVRELKSRLKSITMEAMGKSYNIVYGKPLLKSLDYDADNEVYYGLISSTKGGFSQKIAIKIPIDEAQDFYDGSKSLKIEYDLKNDKIFFKKIEVTYKNKNYLALLDEAGKDYKSSDIKVSIMSRDLNLKSITLLNSTLKIEKFSINKIGYSKSKIAKLNSKDLKELNKQSLKQLSSDVETLSSLLYNTKKVKKNPKSYAIVFGIEDYLLESNVNYSQNSALSFMQYANKLLGVPDENIWAFVGDRKTSSGFIKAQWKNFLSLVENGSTIYFYYSGHGVPGPNGNAYILPSDSNAETTTSDRTFMLKNIYSDLSKTKSKRIVAFVDSCFSGKDDRGNLLFEGVAPVLKVKKTAFDKSKMTIFTAGSSKNFSNQYLEKRERLFSYFLMKGLALGKTDISELFSYVKKNVANKSRKIGPAYIQIPELLGKSAGNIR